MAKTKQEEKLPEIPVTPETVNPEVEINNSQVRDLFHQPIVQRGVVRTLKMRRTLTRPLVSMAKRKTLAVECESDIFVMDLPLKGRAGGMSSVRVFEAKELVPTEAGFIDGDECLVVVHEIMASSLSKAGYESMKLNEDPQAEQQYVTIPGKSLKGALLGFLSGDIEDGKRYRSISVAELEQ
jgi:hypothetical protein